MPALTDRHSVAVEDPIEFVIQPDASKHHRSGNVEHTGPGTGRIAEGQARHKAPAWRKLAKLGSRERVTKKRRRVDKVQIGKLLCVVRQSVKKVAFV